MRSIMPSEDASAPPRRVARRRESLLALVGAVLLIFSAWQIHRLESPSARIEISHGGCRTPALVVSPPSGAELGAAVVFHGLAANRLLMLPLGEELAGEHLRVYLLDLPGHGVNDQPFSFARAEQCAAETLAALAEQHLLRPESAALVGHSMGGAIAIRLADLLPTQATIGISVAPLVLPRRMPANLLIFSAGYDLPLLKSTANQIASAAAGERNSHQDFVERRAFERVEVPRATHVSLLTDARVFAATRWWIERSLFRDSAPSPAKSRNPFLFELTGLVGILLIFPFAASQISKWLGAAASEPPGASANPARGLGACALACLVGILLFQLWIPLRFIRVFSGDYLASLLLVASIGLLLANAKFVREKARFRARALTAAAASGLAVVLGAGAWVSWQMTEMWLTPARWWRFLLLLPALWVYCFSEEIALGQPATNSAKRWATYLSIRLTIWLVAMLGYFALASGQILLLLLVVYLAIFSMLMRLGSDAVRWRTGSASAAALFGAILGAWFLTTVCPIT